MNRFCFLVIAIFLCGAGRLPALVTNDAVTAKIEGAQLIVRLRELAPAKSFTNAATLQLRGKNRRADVPLQIVTRVTETNWQVTYTTTGTGTSNWFGGFTVIHRAGQANTYKISDGSEAKPEQLFASLAGSDFWLVDLSADFFHWPEQRVLRKGVMNGRTYDELESRPATVLPDGYSRVVSRIDRDTGGIVQAQAYGGNGKLLKDFALKEVSKENGVTEMEMRNEQTKTRTTVTFHFDN